MKFLVPCLVTFLLSTQPLHAAPPLTLEEALTTALKSHPQLIEARENLHGAEARAGQALASYYPQISIAADWSKGRAFLAPLGKIMRADENSDVLSLRQTIYDFGRTAGVVDAARSSREAAAKTVAITRQDLALRVQSAFYLLLAAEEQVIATGEAVRAREDVYRQAQEFFHQGTNAKVDVARAEANLYAAKTSLIRAENNRNIAEVELANAMGIASLGKRHPVVPSLVPRTLP
ncbi:MAG TPA: TolC family protein, partial [Geobacteraceae bacterium]